MNLELATCIHQLHWMFDGHFPPEDQHKDDYNDVKEDMQEGCGQHGKLVMAA